MMKIRILRLTLASCLLLLGAGEVSSLRAQTTPTPTPNAPPLVSITNPAYGAAFAAPANVSFEVSASDANGSVSRVEFFVNETKVGESFSAPYAFTVSALADGNYVLSALATDNAGAFASARAIPITVYQSGGIVSNSVQLSGADYAVSESSASVAVTVTRIGFATDEARVDYATYDTGLVARCGDSSAGNTASQRCDYTATEGTLRFAPGEREKVFTVSLNDDVYAEGPETFRVALSNAVNTTLDPTLITATVTINDDDAATGTSNPISATEFFVRRQYLDFLNREPDAPGGAFWTGEINKCNGEAACVDRQRVNTSGAFFISTEFQFTGYYVYRLYRGALGRAPSYAEFVPDLQAVNVGIVVGDKLQPDVIAANKISFANAFVGRPEFRRLYDALSNDQFVDQLFTLTGVQPTLSERNALLVGLNLGTETRTSTLLKIVDGTQIGADGKVQFTTRFGEEFYNQQFNRAFVLAQYFGYLRRDPDDAGYQFWLAKLDNAGGNFLDAEMVRSFILSEEYFNRFGPNR